MKSLILIAIGFALGHWFAHRKPRQKEYRAVGQENLDKINAERREDRGLALERIMQLFDSQEEIANDDVEKLLGISDASVTRYLDELERDGKIEQIGVPSQARYRKK